MPTTTDNPRRYSCLEPLHCLVILDFKNGLFDDQFQSDNGIHKFQMVHLPSMSNSHFVQYYTFVYLLTHACTRSGYIS